MKMMLAVEATTIEGIRAALIEAADDLETGHPVTITNRTHFCSDMEIHTAEDFPTKHRTIFDNN